MRVFFYCCILLCITGLMLPLHGQYTFEGLVLADGTQTPISGAEVYHQTTGDFITTDEQGRFSFSDLPAGEHQIIIFSFQFETLTTTITCPIEEVTTFRLIPLQEDLSEVVISARRAELFALRTLRDTEGTSIYAGKKSEVVVLDLIQGNRATNNSRQIYAQVAGLNIYEGNDGGLQLGIGGRGLDPNRTANFNTRQNGYDISADVLGYPESYYTPPADALSEIQVIRGAASLQYGPQFGGLINFKLNRPPVAKKWSVNTRQSVGSFGLFNSFNAVGARLNKFSFYGYYQYKKGDGYRAHSAFDSHNAYGFLQYQWTANTRISAEFTYFSYLAQQAGGLTDAQFADNPRQSTRTRNWFEVDWKLYNAQLEHEFGKRSTFSLNVFALDAGRNAIGFRGNPGNLNENPITALDEQQSDGSYLSPRDLIRGSFQNWGIESRFLTRYHIGTRKATLLLGAKYYDAENTSLQGPGSNDIDADFSFYTDQYPDYANQSNFIFPNRNIALFAEHIFYLSDQFTITPGARFESIKTESQGNYQQVIFDNAGNPIANNSLTDNRTLPRSLVLFGLGLSYQPDARLELYANLSQNYRSVTFSDIRVVNPTFIIHPDISDEKGFTADLGARGRINQVIAYDLGIYNLLYDDRIGIILDDRANRVRKNIGRAIITGLESLIDFNVAKMLYPDKRELKLSYFINAAFTHSRYVASEENNVVGKQVEFVPAANLKTGLKWGYKNFLSAIQYTYLSKQYTDVQNSTIPQDGDVRSGIIGEIPSYQVVDLSLSYTWKNMKIETGINNLLNEAYFTRRATGYPGPGIIPSDGRSFYLTLAYQY